MISLKFIVEVEPITLNTMSSASFNTDSGNHAGGDSHPFLIGVEDGITTSNATIYIRVTPNTHQYLELRV